jgi:radical SAM superfamily enzyme YgiQ (UPF0313 family)
MTLEPNSAAPQVDYVIQGESEYLLEDLVTGAYPSGTILRTQRITDLDSLPRVDYGLFFDSPRSYDLTIPYTDRRPIFNMTTSRSCSFACSFCMVRDIWGRLWTAHSAERVVDDIGFLVSAYKIGGIYFREDLFTANRQRLLDICRLILSNNLDIHWACETRVDLVSDEETLELMARSGCRGLYIGAESGSQRMLDMYNKEISVDQIQNTCRWARKHGIKVAMSLIVADPRETWEDRLDTWKLCKSARPAFLQLSSYNGIHTGRQTSSFPPYHPRKVHNIEYPDGTWKAQTDRIESPQPHQSPIQ